MITTIFPIRIRYSDTDQMGFVYYGNYAKLFEIGRVELFRELGVSYKQLEDSGVMMPVLDLNVKYIKPATYDDVLSIETTLTEIPSGPRITFEYTIYNQKKQVLTKASTRLVFVDSSTHKPVRMPDLLIQAAKAYLKED